MSIRDRVLNVKKALIGAAAVVVALQAADENVVPRTVLGAVGAVVGALIAGISVWAAENKPV